MGLYSRIMAPAIMHYAMSCTQEDEPRLVTDGGTVEDTGAIDNDYDDSLRDAREEIEAELAGLQTEPMKGGVAMDLVTRQPLFVHRKVADTVVEYHEEEGFNLATYKQHPYLPVTADDAVYECVFISRSAEGAHKIGQTYDYPRGRLMTLPVHKAWQEEDD